MTAPQKLRLQYKDVPLAEALADLGKGHHGLTPSNSSPEDDEGYADDRKVTLDTGEVTTLGSLR